MTAYRQRVRDTIWAIWEANSKFTDLVLVGNRIRPGTTAGWLKTFMLASKPNDYPQVRLDLVKSENSGWTEVTTLDAEDDYFSELHDSHGNAKAAGSGPVTWRFTLEATFTSVLINLDEQDNLVNIAELLILGAMRPLSALNIIELSAMTCDQSETDRNESKGTRRLKTVMRFTITTQFELRDLVASVT